MSEDDSTGSSPDIHDDANHVPGGLLGELDAQQDDVIRRLDRLNHQIEQLMRDWSRASSDAA